MSDIMSNMENMASEALGNTQVTPPEPLLQGSFALYQHAGGYLIAWKKRGDSETRHLPLPAMIINMAAQMSGKTPADIIAEFTASVTA